MKKTLGALLAALLAGAVLAQTAPTAGEITKLDKAAGRVTLKHGGVKNLDMPPMTMNFRARDPKLLENLAVGDRVRFVAERVDGQFVVTQIGKTP